MTVQEVERCVYEAIFETPAKCSLAHAEQVRATVQAEVLPSCMEGPPLLSIDQHLRRPTSSPDTGMKYEACSSAGRQDCRPAAECAVFCPIDVISARADNSLPPHWPRPLPAAPRARFRARDASRPEPRLRSNSRSTRARLEFAPRALGRAAGGRLRAAALRRRFGRFALCFGVLRLPGGGWRWWRPRAVLARCVCWGCAGRSTRRLRFPR